VEWCELLIGFFWFVFALLQKFVRNYEDIECVLEKEGLFLGFESPDHRRLSWA